MDCVSFVSNCTFRLRIKSCTGLAIVKVLTMSVSHAQEQPKSATVNAARPARSGDGTVATKETTVARGVYDDDDDAAAAIIIILVH